jgi:hypothetical protein
MISVTSKSIQRARRVALRQRSTNACTPCKQAKTKCVNYRPCSRCSKRSQEIVCSDDLKDFNGELALNFDASWSGLIKPKKTFKSKRIMPTSVNSPTYSFLDSPYSAVSQDTTLPMLRPGISVFVPVLVPIDQIARYWWQAGWVHCFVKKILYFSQLRLTVIIIMFPRFGMEEVQAVLQCLPDSLRAILNEV